MLIKMEFRCHADMFHILFSSTCGTDDMGQKPYARLLHRSLSRNLNLAGKCDLGSRQCVHKSNSCGASRKDCAELASQDVKLFSEKTEDDAVDNSLALVPFRANEEDDKSSDSITVQELRAFRPGWSFLRWIFLPKQQHAEKSAGKKTSMVQRVLRLPSTHSSAVVYPDQKQSSYVQDDDRICDLDREQGAIVPFGCEGFCPPSPDNTSKSIPKELEGLHDKYSSTCRLFNYEELLAATSNLMPGIFHQL